MSMRPLPPEVIAQIKSSTTITSLNGVACELLKNSLDASSRKVEISVDYSRGSCVLEDDGLGILPSEFGDEGGLGKLYYSSKLSSPNPVHGGRGTFLASLSAMSLLSITSRHHQHYSHNTLTMHKSAVVSRQTPSPSQLHLTSFSHGTRATVRDLFGNMPVRVKQRAMSFEKSRGNSREWEELKRDVVLLLLAWPSSVAVTIRETSTNDKMQIRGRTSAATSIPYENTDLSAICGILSQASLISFEDKSYWIFTRASTPSLVINAAISLLPSVTKHTQFISFGIQPLVTHDTRSILHDEINRMFLNSSFGNEEAAVDLDASEIDRRAKDKRYKGDGFTNRELKGGKKGIDRWPMFYINIRQNGLSVEGRSLDMDRVLDDQGSSLSAIVELLQAMIWEFLIKHHFRPRHSRGHRAKPGVDAGDENAVDLKLSDQPTSHLKDRVVSTDRKDSAASPRIKNPMLFGQPLSITNTPFNVWTRVKVGSKPMKIRNVDQGQQTTDVGNISRPSSAPPSSGSRNFSLTANPIKRSTTPLVSSNGKIVRRPFEEVAFSSPAPRKTVMKPGQPASEPPKDPDNDSIGYSEEVIAWTNPITKAKSFVNQRTGLTIRSDKTTSSDPESVSLSMTRANVNRLQLPKPTSLQKEEPSPWLKDILKTWNNPVFCPVEASIPQATFDGLEAGTQELLQGRWHHCTQIDIDRAFKQSSAKIDGRISKTALGQAEVISQVDSKFILVKLELVSVEGIADLGSNNLLVLIDQHAADERIRIEALWEDFFALAVADSSMPTASGVRTILLDKPIHFEVSIKESRLLSKYKEHFTYWGILFDLSSNPHPGSTSKSGAMQRFTVRSLPPSIIERCKLDPRLLINLIRTESWKIHDSGASLPSTDGDWLQRIHNCPQGIIDMLNSRACRSAIMFNDELSKEQCQTLVSRLAKCKFPFQCAHGRPSLVPLVDVGNVDMRARIKKRDRDFGAAFNEWKGKMK